MRPADDHVRRALAGHHLVDPVAERRQVEAREQGLAAAEQGGSEGEVEFVERWDGSAPLVIVPTSYPTLTERDVRRLGKIKLVIYANQVLRAGVKAQEELLSEIKRAGGIDTIDDWMVPVSRIFELQGVTRMKDNEAKYLP